jgi:nucleoside-diphosphate-sugar epimerase
MRIAVTGATGGLGQQVVAAALKRGYEVLRVVRRSENDLAPNDQTHTMHYDLLTGGSFAPVWETCDAVVHCGALVGDRGSRSLYHLANAERLRDWFTEWKNSRPSSRLKHFVHISSLGVYPARHHFGTDELAPIATKSIDGYTASKVQAEHIARAAIADGLPITLLRPGFIYGPYDRHVLPRLIRLLRSGRFAFIGDGLRILDQVYSGHVVDAVFRALVSPTAIGETFNIRDARGVTRLEFISELCMQMNLRRPTLHIPDSVGKGLAKLQGFTKIPFRITPAAYKFLALNLEFSVAKANSTLGLPLTGDFREQLRRALAADSA